MVEDDVIKPQKFLNDDIIDDEYEDRFTAYKDYTDVSLAPHNYLLIDNDSKALRFLENNNAYLTFDTTKSAEKVVLSKSLSATAGSFSGDVTVTGNVTASNVTNVTASVVVNTSAIANITGSVLTNASNITNLVGSVNTNISGIIAVTGSINTNASAITNVTASVVTNASTISNVAASVATNIITIGSNTTHRTSDGTDHSYIDQSVVSGADVVFGSVTADTVVGSIIAPSVDIDGGTINGVTYEDIITVSSGAVTISKDDTSNIIELGQTNSNQYALIDLKGDSTYTDYGLRLIRWNQGANALSELHHRGTGSLDIRCQENANIGFWISGVEQISVTDGLIAPITDNDVSIGSSSKRIKDVYVAGSVVATTGFFSSDVNVVGSINNDKLTASKPVFTDASKNLVSTGTLGYDQGGTGQTTFAQGDIIYASSSNVLAKLAKGTDNHVLTMNGNVPNWEAGAAGGSSSDYMKVSDVKSSGTHAGTFTSGAWRTRTLNTEDSDTGSNLALSSDQITLAAGTYECRISCPAEKVDAHQARLYNTTGTALILLGTTEFSQNAATYSQTRSVIVGRFTIAASQALEVQHRCSGTLATFGLGIGDSNNWGDVVYTVAEFWKVA